MDFTTYSNVFYDPLCRLSLPLATVGVRSGVPVAAWAWIDTFQFYGVLGVGGAPYAEIILGKHSLRHN